MDCIGNRTLVSLLHERLICSPDNLFLVHEGPDGHVTELTYQQFADAVAAVSGGLQRLGVSRGTKVCLHLENRPEFPIAFFALASLGAVIVNSNTLHTARELQYVANHSDAQWVITQPTYVALWLQEVMPHCPQLQALIVTDERYSGCSTPPAVAQLRFADLFGPAIDLFADPPQSDDVMEFIFTSGTTAMPKAVMLTHANCVWCSIESARQLALRPDDRNLTSLPIFHVNAQGVMLGTFSVGATLILLQRYSAARFMSQVRRHRATIFSMMPTILRTVMLQPPSPHDRKHSARFVKYVIQVPDHEQQAFEERFGVRLLNGYGLSEAMVSVTGPPPFGDISWPSIGLPLIGRELRIVAEDGSELPVDQLGEIIIRGVPGRTLMLGYYKDPDTTARTLRDGWLHTGDLGYMDARGYFYYSGRLKEMIKRGGENVAPSEVEMVLQTHPAVDEVAVIGIPDPIFDEAVKAFVVLKSPEAVSAEDLIAFCRQHLAKFKVPSVIEFRANLPKTSIGKIEKRALITAERSHDGASAAGGLT